MLSMAWVWMNGLRRSRCRLYVRVWR
jgi:hypothetical protein